MNPLNKTLDWSKYLDSPLQGLLALSLYPRETWSLYFLVNHFSESCLIWGFLRTGHTRANPADPLPRSTLSCEYLKLDQPPKGYRHPIRTEGDIDWSIRLFGEKVKGSLHYQIVKSWESYSKNGGPRLGTIPEDPNPSCIEFPDFSEDFYKSLPVDYPLGEICLNTT